MWDGIEVPGVYTHAFAYLEGDEVVEEMMKKIEGKKPAIVVLDEVSKVHENPEFTEEIIKRIEEFNNNGVRVILVGGNDREMQSELSSVVTRIVDLQNAPETMSESDLRVHRDANRVYEDDEA